MDNMGYVCSAFDRSWWMTVPSSLVGEGGQVAIAEEAPVEIRPCTGREGGGATCTLASSYTATGVG